MKEKFSLYIALALLMIIGSACSDDFLEEKQNYGETTESFYEVPERVNWYINNLYYDYFSGYRSPTGEGKSNYTEETGGISDELNPTITLEDADDVSNFYGNTLSNKIQNDPYNRIRDCNEFIEKIDEIGINLDTDFRDHAKGQVYYLRAVQYFRLMRIYGGVPIVKTVQPASSTDESIKIPRASISEMTEFIASDLDMAASLLPSTWPASDYGRCTKGAALALKSRVLLTAASPLFNKDWDDTGNARWQEALQAGLDAETELLAAGYGLYGSSAKDWEDMFLIDNSFCSEAINVQLLGDGTSDVTLNNSWESTIRLTSQDGGGGKPAPKEMIDLFPMADGSRPTVANGYDDFLFFVNRDPRFYRTFAFSGYKWGYKDNPDATVWAYRWINSENQSFDSDNNTMESPAFVRKMTNLNASNESSFEYSGTDIFEYRYAELLLNIAECYAATGNITNCLSYLGRIRERVGIPSANNYGIGSLADKYAAIEACLYERRVELAYEGKRFWDIQRWMLYNDDPAADNTTCASLGVDPINGTQRTGHYLQFKDVVTDTDPLADVRETISVSPDDANFQEELQNLATFYTDNFVFAEIETPWDNVDGEPVQIDWRQNYYIIGLVSEVLTTNPWLEQTIGWKDQNGDFGTYEYR